MKLCKYLLVSLLLLCMIATPVVEKTIANGCTINLKFQQGSTEYWINNIQQSPMETAPVNRWDRLFLVVRYVTKSLPETEIAWDGEERKVTITQGISTKIELWINKSNSVVNGVSTQIDPENSEVVPFINNGRTLLPLRFISENLGAGGDDDIVWDAETKTVTINFSVPCEDEPKPVPDPVPVIRSKPEIIRDKYGVAHVFSETDAGAFYGLGYVMATDRPVETLKLYAQARGESYLYEGVTKSALNGDYKILNLKIWSSINEGFEDLPAEVQEFAISFTDGFNSALHEHENLPEWAFEITPIDPLAVAKMNAVSRAMSPLSSEISSLSRKLRTQFVLPEPRASNEWALSPNKTSTGFAYLQTDPHLSFNRHNAMMEIHLEGETFKYLGGVIPGAMVTSFFGTNGKLAWASTANQPDTADLYELKITDDYIYDGKERELDIQILTMGDGSKRKSLWSHYGPVIFNDIKNHKMYSARISTLDLNDLLSESLARTRATSIEELKKACSTLSFATINFAVATTGGDIFYYYNTRCFRRPEGLNCRRILDGSTSKTEWGELIPFDELPQELNTKGGWLQNCNVAPWFISPETSITSNFPAEICTQAKSQGIRGQLSSRLLSEKDDWDIDSLKALAMNSYSIYGERIVPTLLYAKKEKFKHEESLEIIEGLSNWDYVYDYDFEFGMAFELIVAELKKARTRIEQDSLPSWDELSAPQKKLIVNTIDSASGWLLKHYGKVNKPWSECSRLFVGDESFGIGCPSQAMQTLYHGGGTMDEDGILHVEQGSVFMMLFQMSDPVKVWSSYPISLNENPDSPNFYDAPERYANQEFKPSYFTREEVMANLVLSGKKPSPKPGIEKTPPGGTLITKVKVDGIGDIVVRCKLPENPRYPEGAPIVISSSGFFVPFQGFHTCIDTTEIGCIKVDYLWPGCEDKRLNVASDGEYDHGGPDCLRSFAEVVAFACGEVPSVDGFYISELLMVNPLTENVGIYAFSHSGVVATNVMALYGESFPNLKWFVGRENPTIDEMYPLELGYYLDDKNKTPVYNPFYNPEDYTPTTINVDYSTVGWIQNNEYPEGRPFFKMEDGRNHILSHKHPTMWDKTYYSRKLTHALLDNGALTLRDWPENVATPAEADSAWETRITAFNYPKLRSKLPNLKTMLIFQDEDHVQAAPDKPHIHQAWDGFHLTANLWCRLNPDQVYVEELHGRKLPSNRYPDTLANIEPNIWNDVRGYGYKGLSGRYNTTEVPYAGIAEMCDRERADNWSIDLNEILYEYKYYKRR